MAERVVSWQALANFSQIAREARKARKELAELRAEQAKVNAQNAASANTTTPGSARNVQRVAAEGRAARDTARATRELSEAQRDRIRYLRAAKKADDDAARGLREVADYSRRLSRETRASEASLSGVAGGLRNISRETRSTSSGLRSTDSSMAGFARRAREVETSSTGAGRGVGRLKSGMNGLGPILKRDAVTLVGVRNAFLALVIPGLLGFINILISSVSSLTAGLIGLAGAIVPVVGLLGALPGALAAAAGGFGVLVAGFAGIGSALKEYQTQQKNATKTSATAAKQAQVDGNKRVAAARRQRNAQQAVAQAEENAAETARSNARAIADAQRNLADARLRARDVAVNSARAIENAERNLANAQENAISAQRGITEARRQAKQQIEDLKNSIRDLALEEEGASLSVEEARQRLQRVLNDPASTDLERRQAKFAVKEAEARLQDVRDQEKQSTKELVDAQKKGIEGSDEVVQARKQEADASQSVVDAQRELSDAHQDAKRNQQDAARAITDAQRGVADAQREAAKATRDSQRAIRDASENIADLAATVETEAIPAVDKFKEAMAKLTPEARAVVMQLIAMKPLLDQLRATAQRGMLPGVLEFLKESVKLFPLFNSFVGKVSGRFGDFFSDIGKAMTTAGAMESWKNILNSTSRVIDTTVDAAENLVFVLGDILEAGGPLTEWLAETIKGWTDSWRAMTEGEEGQARLKAFFEDARKVASQLGRIIGRTADALFNMGKAFRPVGQFLLDGLEKLVTRWDDWTKSVAGEDELKSWAARSIVTLGKMRELIDRIFEAFENISKKVNIDNILDMFTNHLVPALETFMSIFTGDLLNNLGLIAGNIADIIAAFGPDGAGVLGTFTDALVILTGALADIVKHKAAVHVIGALIALLAAKKAVNVIGTITGVNNVARSIATVQKRGGIASGSKSRVARAAGGVASVAATSAGVGGFLPTRESSTRRAQKREEKRRRTAASATPRRSASRISSIPSAGPIIVGGGRRDQARKARRAEPAARPARPRRALGAAGRGAGRATGAAGTAAALGSLLPGPIGAVAGKLTILLTVLQLVGPALLKIGKTLGNVFLPALKAIAGAVATAARFLGGGFFKVLTAVGKAAVFLGKGILTLGRIFGTVFLRIVSVVAKAMLLIGRAMLANPWILLIAALVLVVFLVIKYWDQIYGFVKKYVGIIFNWLKANWKTIVKILMGPMGFVLVKIIENWGKIWKAISGFVMKIINWVKTNWKKIIGFIIGPILSLIILAMRHWDRFKSLFFAGVQILVDGVKKRWNKLVGIIGDAVKNAKDKALGFFRDLRDGTSKWIGKIGDAISALKKKAETPISWIIDHVINGGILKAYNWVADKLGVDTVAPIPNPFTKSTSTRTGNKTPGRASGGVVPEHRSGGLLRGPGTGTSDSILGLNGRGMPTARVSAGEFVVREKVTKKNRKFLEAFNAGKIKLGGFMNGGLIGGLKKLASGGLVWPTNTRALSGNYSGHSGVDIAAGYGAPIYSPKAAAVNYVGWGRGFGQAIFERFSSGLSAVFGHTSQTFVKAGQKVKAGQLIGRVGQTGNATGPHLHFEVNSAGGFGTAANRAGTMRFLSGADVSGPDKGFGPLGTPLMDFLNEFKKRAAPGMALLSKAGDSPLAMMAREVPKKLYEQMKDKISKASESFAFGPNALPGTGVARWLPLIVAGLKRVGLPLSLTDNFMRQIATESGGNPRAVQGNIGDVNNRSGDLAKGLLQVIGATFAAYRDPALPNDRFNPWSNIVASMRYVKARYGSSAEGVIGHGHGYARGTSGASPGPRWVGEDGPEIVHFKGGEKVVPNQKLHTGGFVKGAKPGIHARWVRALRAQLFMNSNSDYFGGDLKTWISKHDRGPYPVGTYKPSLTMLSKVASALKASKSGLSLTSAARAARVDPAHLWRSWTSSIVSGGKTMSFYQYMMSRGVPNSKYATLSKSIGAYRDRRNVDTRNLESLLGLPQDGRWGSEITGPLSHVLDHAMGYKVGSHGHTTYDPTPWNAKLSLLNDLLAEQSRTNALNAEFDKILSTFDSWGLTYVKRKFTEVGPADGLTNMRELVKNQAYATQYNTLLKAEYARTDKENDPTEQQIEAFIKAVNDGVRIGLQAASGAASVSLDTGATLYDKITADKRWGTVPASKWAAGSRLAMDVDQLRKLFRFARGGTVPGRGYSDTVMALLTPNEFVVRRDAAQAIERDAPGTLDYMNNYDRYAGGGFVAAGVDRPALRTTNPSDYGRRVAASHADEHATKVVKYEFNTTVHNPIAEPAGVSVQKRVQRVARLGLLAGEDKK